MKTYCNCAECGKQIEIDDVEHFVFIYKPVPFCSEECKNNYIEQK